MGIRVDRFSSFLAGFLEALARELPSERVDLIILDQGEEVVLRKSWPEPDGCAPGHVEELIRQSAREKRPLLLAGRERWPISLFRSERNSDGESHLCLPLFLRDQPCGAICLSRNPEAGSFSSEDLEVLIALSRPLLSLVGIFLGQPGKEEPALPRPAVEPIIGSSPSSRLIRMLIDRVKDADAPVFIYGESGTGKELIARSIHERGVRRHKPFVAVNCGAIPDHLLESELFGHARGAFTGALRDKAGLIEEAHGGTFFLDEVGDLSLPLQAKLLRLLQEREIRRIGENRTRRVDVRFISATNKNIEEEVERGNFRVDLYYRLRILTIEVPPLRERKSDLLLLIDHFIDRYSREMKKGKVYLSPPALELMLEYPWPGNVRELQNEIQRCLILCGEEGLIKEEHLSPKINPRREASLTSSFNYREARAEFEKRFLRQALRRFENSKARTAEGIGLTRQGLFKLLKKHGLG